MNENDRLHSIITDMHLRHKQERDQRELEARSKERRAIKRQVNDLKLMLNRLGE